jgi:6-phosphogluconolactonase
LGGANLKHTQQFRGYIGTYTKGNSKGIYSFILDTKIERITDVCLVAEQENPTYLAFSKNNQYLYSVVKVDNFGGVAAYAVHERTGELSPLNKQVSKGAPPCHVSVGKQNLNVFSANYHKGTVEAFSIDRNSGFIEPVMSIVEHQGSGPDTRQEKPHVHYAAFSPDEQFIIIVDLGTDEIYTYVLKERNLTEVKRLSVKPGSGPRHLVFHPDGKYAYVMTEFSSEVIVLSFDPEVGSFKEVQTISTIPEDFKENNQGSAIHITSDGQFIYAGNRGHDSIAVFKVDDESHQISLIERVTSQGNWPRDFSLDPSEKYLIAANQESNNLVLFSRNEETGTLTLLQSDIEVPSPVCVKFLHGEKG